MNQATNESASAELQQAMMPIRAEFIKWIESRHIDTSEDVDAWGRRKFKHSHVEAMWEGYFHGKRTKASPTATDAGSVDTPEFRKILRQFTYPAKGLAELIAHIHTWRDQGSKAAGPCVICGGDEPRTGTCGSFDPRALCNASPAAAEVTGSQVEVKVERNRVWIVMAHQSFMLAYEADTDEELNWYADQLRNVLSGFTHDVKSGAPKPSTTPALDKKGG